jgi:excisionase family DNA binding protein
VSGVAIALPDEVVERIAERAAELVAKRGPSEPIGYLDVQGAADFLACNKSRIYALVSAGRLPHKKDGSRLLFAPAELRAYVEAGGARRP